MTEIQGTCDERFTGLRKVLADSLASGADVGASIAVTLDGKSVVDLWGGWVDEAHSAPWERDTIINVYSTTKTIAALCILVLVERGLVDLDAPVADYWPGFAANGKDGILVRHVMSHTAGISGWEEPVDITDRETSTAALAKQAPWWEPGTAFGYHAMTQGHLLGEIVLRTTGRTLGRFLREEIAGPLGADFHIGVDPSDFARIAALIPTSTMSLPASEPTEIALRSFANAGASGPADTLTAEWRQAEIPAANGHGNARSVARIQSVVANGGEVDGVRLLSPATIDQIFREQAYGMDPVLGNPVRFGIGYALPMAEGYQWTPLPMGRVGFWGGFGGSVAVADVDRRMSIAYVMNRMDGVVGDARSRAVLESVYDSLGVATVS